MRAAMHHLFMRRDTNSIESLQQQLRELPPLQNCDKSPRIVLLERLVESLSTENATMRSRGYSDRPAGLSYTHMRPASKQRRPVAVGVKGKLFSHPNTIRADVQTKLPPHIEVSWISNDYPDGNEATANVRVAFFRVSSRVSPAELDDLRAWCVGQANFVMFLHMEMSEAKCNDVDVQAYVKESLSQFAKPTMCASMSFRESILYPTSSGLNAISLAALASFLTQHLS